MWNMAQANDLDKTQFSEQVQTILISLEFLQKLSLTQNGEIKLREGKIFFMCWKLSVISFVKSNISKRSPVFFQYTNYGKRELRVMVIIMSAPLLFDMNDSVRTLAFNCSATSWQMILSLLYENSQISVIILNNGFCVRVWVSFCHNLSNFLSEHQVVSSFNSTIVINCMIYTDSLSFCHIHHHQFAQESYWQILNLELNVFKRKEPGSVTADESDDNAEQDQEQVQLSTPTPLWTKSATN